MYKWLQSTETIKFSVADRIARITLNRPEKRNALSDTMLKELELALLEADDRQDVTVTVLDGAGKDFCSGYDLMGTYGGASGEQPPFDPALYRTSNKTFDDDTWAMERTLERRIKIFDLHKPVIAKVHGNCLAGGTDLAFLCDIVVAADNARIGFPATRANGTPPTQFWLYLMGPQWAKRMLFTGDALSGADAARLGLVLDAVPAERLEEEVMALARRCTYVDADMLACHKRAVNVGLELMGARTLQRMVLELDARAHLVQGPRRTQFRADVAAHGLKEALKRRDEPFGDGMVRPNVT
ncbi:MAG: crotonase/enoyl-CoA hydratase family protein [Gammaproteobacteria bacterium]